MPVMNDSSAVTANTTGTSVLAGRQLERLPRRAAVTLVCAASATGLYANLTAGQASLTDQSGALVSVYATAGRLVEPDDILMPAHGVGARQLFLTFRNSTGGTITVYWKLRVEFI